MNFVVPEMGTTQKKVSVVKLLSDDAAKLTILKKQTTVCQKSHVPERFIIKRLFLLAKTLKK